MSKKQIIHIHTDRKFISNETIFQGDKFKNKSVIIVNKDFIDTDSEIFGTSEQDIQEIINLCSHVDLVVVYNLDAVKMEIVSRLPKQIKVAWRFFGVELYSRQYKRYISKKTLHTRHTFKDRFKLLIRKSSLLSAIFRFFLLKEHLDEKFELVVNRIDYLLILSREEYDYLNGIWKNLPTFVKLPHLFKPLNLKGVYLPKKESQKPIVVVGNSRSVYNNHIDIIDIIEKCVAKHRYKFTFLFNYGEQNSYTQVIQERTRNRPYYNLIEEFIPVLDFLKFYETPSALVVNSYRQLAWDNIRMALQLGVKVYLSDRNVHKRFLINEGFLVYSIEDFEKDLKNDTLGYDKVVAMYNLEALKKFYRKYTIEDFQESLINHL